MVEVMALTPKKIIKNQYLIGRKPQWQRLETIGQQHDPQLLVLYGRRRVGKTELLEQVYAKRNILKFEGVRNKSAAEQRWIVLWQLSEYTGDDAFKQKQVSSWLEVFKIIYDCLPAGKWTLYFEEVQWLANYSDAFIDELKYTWDNYFRHKNELLVILCGSSPSFIVNKILLSKSLYNRSQHELHLREFSVKPPFIRLPESRISSITS